MISSLKELRWTVGFGIFSDKINKQQETELIEFFGKNSYKFQSFDESDSVSTYFLFRNVISYLVISFHWTRLSKFLIKQNINLNTSVAIEFCTMEKNQKVHLFFPIGKKAS